MRLYLQCCVAIVALWAAGNTAFGQSFGVELHNTLMPASGAMGGASIAQPQDLVSGLNGNPATLTQFSGTQFIFGGAWAEPTFNMSQSSNIPVIGPPLIEPYSGKSAAPGVPAGNIGVTQSLADMGLPVTFGLGFVSTAGGFVDYRDNPNSHGTDSGMAIFSVPLSMGIDLNERLSIGATMALGIAFFDGPFVGTGGMTPDYALRGTLGANYKLTDATKLGAYYQTKQSFHFSDAFVLNPGPNQISRDIFMDLPENIGFGIANSSLLDGQLLIAVDVLYKLYDEAALFKNVYDNQWVVQFGTQYSMGNYRLRAGYAWAQDQMDQNPGPDFSGIVQPGGLASVRYTQGLLAIANQHRLTGGIGIVDVMPGLNADLMAGGMFENSEQLGPLTNVSVASYWVGVGLTWHYDQPRGKSCTASNCTSCPQ